MDYVQGQCFEVVGLVQDFDTINQELCPESCMWFGLGNKRSLVKVTEKSWLLSFWTLKHLTNHFPTLKSTPTI